MVYYIHIIPYKSHIIPYKSHINPYKSHLNPYKSHINPILRPCPGHATIIRLCGSFATVSFGRAAAHTTRQAARSNAIAVATDVEARARTASAGWAKRMEKCW